MTEQIRTSSKIIISSDCCNISIHNNQIVFNKSNKKLHFISFYLALTTNGDRSQYKTNVLFITRLFILIQASATFLFLYNFYFIWNSLYSRLLYNLITGFYVLIFTLQSWVIPSSAGRRLAGLPGSCVTYCMTWRHIRVSSHQHLSDFILRGQQFSESLKRFKGLSIKRMSDLKHFVYFWGKQSQSRLLVCWLARLWVKFVSNKLKRKRLNDKKLSTI